jgi:hypothetical protein
VGDSGAGAVGGDSGAGGAGEEMEVSVDALAIDIGSLGSVDIDSLGVVAGGCW